MTTPWTRLPKAEPAAAVEQARRLRKPVLSAGERRDATMPETLAQRVQTPSLRLLVLRTKQLDRLRDFYAPLGVTFVPERHGDGPLHYAGALEGAVLELYPLDGDAESCDPLTRIGFAVRDLAATLRGLEAAGGEVVWRPRETEWGLRAVIRDPDGRAVELYQG
jgi:lactoylglutathione lyase